MDRVVDDEFSLPTEAGPRRGGRRSLPWDPRPLSRGDSGPDDDGDDNRPIVFRSADAGVARFRRFLAIVHGLCNLDYRGDLQAGGSVEEAIDSRVYAALETALATLLTFNRHAARLAARTGSDKLRERIWDMKENPAASNIFARVAALHFQEAVLTEQNNATRKRALLNAVSRIVFTETAINL